MNVLTNMFTPTAYVIIFYHLITLAVYRAKGGPDSEAKCQDGKVVNTTTQGKLILIDTQNYDEQEKTWVYCTSNKQGNQPEPNSYLK